MSWFSIRYCNVSNEWEKKTSNRSKWNQNTMNLCDSNQGNRRKRGKQGKNGTFIKMSVCTCDDAINTLMLTQAVNRTFSFHLLCNVDRSEIMNERQQKKYVWVKWREQRRQTFEPKSTALLSAKKKSCFNFFRHTLKQSASIKYCLI